MTFLIINPKSQVVDLDDPRDPNRAPAPLYIYPGCEYCGAGWASFGLEFAPLDGVILCQHCQKLAAAASAILETLLAFRERK